MSTPSYIARPTSNGYTGIYVHYDGDPSSKLPFLLAAFQYHFRQDLEAMTRHLVDDVAIGWKELGSDLLDGAPAEIIAALAGGEHWPSSTLDNLVTPDGSPPTRMTVTDSTAAEQDLEWVYVLRPAGIEVIPAQRLASGPVIAWDTDPRTDFNNPGAWPRVAPSITTEPPSPGPVATSASHTSGRR
ncbi:hypothetical protein [Streptomyces sp. NPDC026589]|uniref:hypothetical protein n=1 Tax=Streptomyces sp. NPDC026589 TaxID=3155609 RepID=UPI0034096160